MHVRRVHLPSSPAPAAALFAIACVASARAEPRSAADFLSEDHFPGYHVLEPRGSSLLVYVDSRKPREDGKYQPLTVPDIDRWVSMKDARKALNATLRMKRREPLQTPWALFDPQGKRLLDVGEMLALPVSFLIMLGQWMWPAVHIGFEQHAEGVQWGRALKMQTLSVRPMVFQVDGFILPEETEELVKIGKSTDMFNSEGMLITEDVKSNRAHDTYRTSTQAWLHRYQSPVVRDLDDRTANLSRIPASHNEEAQLLRYGQGQFYHAHLDWADLKQYNGQRDLFLRHHYGWNDRVATLFWYLNDVGEGGETVFPKYGDPICSHGRSWCPGASRVIHESCDVGLRVSPRQGRVVLWYNFLPNGIGDQNALHGGCPPAEGLEKWSANKWISTKPQSRRDVAWDPTHPALRRFRWREDALEASADAQDGSCRFAVESRLGDESAELLWVSPNNEDMVSVSRLPAGQETPLNSFDQHVFVVRASGRISEPMVCRGRSSKFVISEDFAVTPVSRIGAKDEL